MSTCMLFNGNSGFKISFKRPLPFVVMQCLSWRKKLQHVAHYQGLVFDSSDQVWMKLNATVKIYWSSSQPISILEKSELILNLNKKHNHQIYRNLAPPSNEAVEPQIS